jgi:hypothetical protein
LLSRYFVGQDADEQAYLVLNQLRKQAKVVAPSRLERTSSMTTIKLLATGLIAITALTSTAVAREKFAAGRTRVIVHGTPCDIFNAGHDGCWIVWEGIPIWFGPSVRGVPGHICDDGDNARIC